MMEGADEKNRGRGFVRPLRTDSSCALELQAKMVANTGFESGDADVNGTRSHYDAGGKGPPRSAKGRLVEEDKMNPTKNDLS